MARSPFVRDEALPSQAGQAQLGFYAKERRHFVRKLSAQSLWLSMRYWIHAYEAQGLHNQKLRAKVDRKQVAKLDLDPFFHSITVRLWASAVPCAQALPAARHGPVRSIERILMRGLEPPSAGPLGGLAPFVRESTQRIGKRWVGCS